MIFTIPCFVRVEDTVKRKNLMEWLTTIGYTIGNLSWAEYGLFIRCYESEGGFAVAIASLSIGAGIDCGENIEMFKALAAMNSDNDWEQWFVADCIMKFDVLKGHVKTESGRRIIYPGEWFKVLVPHIGNVRAKWMSLYRPKFLFHKATKDEIIEHFKKSEL